MASSRATENVLAGPPCSIPSPRYSGEKAAVQGDKMGKIAVKAASRMFRVSPPSTSSLRPAPYGGSSIGAPAGAGRVRRTASPGDQLRPQVHGPGHSGLPACPAPSITLRSFHVSPRECRYRLFLGMCHVRRVDGTTARPLPASGYVARGGVRHLCAQRICRFFLGSPTPKRATATSFLGRWWSRTPQII